MFVSTGLQNQRECIINEQLLIRDDIQRVAAVLESLKDYIIKKKEMIVYYI